MFNFSSQLLVLMPYRDSGPQQPRRQQPVVEFLNSSHSCGRCIPVVHPMQWFCLSDKAYVPQHPCTSQGFPGGGTGSPQSFIGQIACFSQFSNSLSSWLPCLSPCVCPEPIKCGAPRFLPPFTSGTTHESRDFHKDFMVKMAVALKQNTCRR